MIVNDIYGKYMLEVDKNKRIVYERTMGYWKPEDFYRFNNDYEVNVLPLLCEKSWAKCCDLRAYKASMITEEIRNHLDWLLLMGFSAAAIILDTRDIYSSVVELQIKTSARDMPIALKFFTCLSNAKKWLNHQGFQ